jgi:hypothetical protein
VFEARCCIVEGAASVGWLLLESLVAFVILVAIVAWTMGPLRKRRPPDRDATDSRDVPPH